MADFTLNPDLDEYSLVSTVQNDGFTVLERNDVIERPPDNEAIERRRTE